MATFEHEHITSTKNQHVQHIRELLAKKNSREESGDFVVEGVRLSEEALKTGVVPKLVFFSQSCSSRGMELVQQAQCAGSKIYSIPSHIMDALSGTETTQGILMVVQNPCLPLPECLNFIVIIDQLRDPGNLGTILRSAVAAGAQAVFCTPGNVDAWSPKVVRSAMGAHFHVPVISTSWPKIQNICKTQKTSLKILLAESGEGISLWEADLKQPIALVIGGEAEGASAAVKAEADILLNIPMPGGFESLNAGAAASIILFEVVRQRRPFSF